MSSNNYILALANSVLKAGEKKQIELSPLKLQKLMYISVGCSLVRKDQMLESNKDKAIFEAWPLGPVSPDVYHSVKVFGGNTITVLIPNDERKVYMLRDSSVIKRVMKNYGNLSASRLVELSHGSAWKRTFAGGEGKGKTIKLEWVEDEFRRNWKI